MIPAIIKVVSASHVGEYRIEIKFDDGSIQIVDSGPFLQRAIHPDIRAYLDRDRFQSFRVEYGDLLWGDYDLCFPVIDLYTNRILHTSEVGTGQK